MTNSTLFKAIVLTAIVTVGVFSKGIYAANSQSEAIDSITWVAGEELNIEWDNDSLFSVVDLEESSDEKNWKTLKKSNPAAGKVGKIKWKADSKFGKRMLRVRNGKTGKVKKKIKINMLPPAGSEETGAFLEYNSIFDSTLFSNNDTEPRYLRGKHHRQALFRLNKGKGSKKILPKLEKVIQNAIDTMNTYTYYNCLPIIITHTHYHYAFKEKQGVFKRKFFAAAFPKDMLNNNNVMFMTDDVFTSVGKKDKPVKIFIETEGNMIEMLPNDKVFYSFKDVGKKELRISVEFNSGKIKETIALIYVKEMQPMDPTLINDALAESSEEASESPEIRSRMRKEELKELDNSENFKKNIPGDK